VYILAMHSVASLVGVILSAVYRINKVLYYAHEIMDAYCKYFGIGHRVMSHDWNMLHSES